MCMEAKKDWLLYFGREKVERGLDFCLIEINSDQGKHFQNSQAKNGVIKRLNGYKRAVSKLRSHD